MKQVDNVIDRLSSLDRLVISDRNLISSAVILPLLYREGELCVLFTKRSDSVEHHKGEISFPGGVLDNEDNGFEGCVLRELSEEIGVYSADVKVLGLLDDIKTVASPFVITPFVGLIPYPYNFTINRDEVDDLIILSINSLLHSCRYKEVFMQNRQVSYFYCGEHTVWGATGIILKQFLSLVFAFKPNFT